MIINPFHFDIIILTIFIIFAFLSFLKGFIKDFFSTLSLLISATTSYFSYPIISQFVDIGYSNRIFLNLGLRFLIFVIALIICSFVFSRISKILSDKMPTLVDQSLGLAFGLSKCYFLFAFLLAIIISFYAIHPSTNLSKNTTSETKNINNKFNIDWLKKSKSYDLLKYGSIKMQPVAETVLLKIESDIKSQNFVKEKKDETKKQNYNIDEDYDRNNENLGNSKETKKSIQNDTQDKSGYNKEEIKKMKRLIEIMSK